MASKNAGNITGSNGGYTPNIHNLNTDKRGLAGPQFAKASPNFKDVTAEKATASEKMAAVRKKKKVVSPHDGASPVNKKVVGEDHGVADENVTDIDEKETEQNA